MRPRCDLRDAFGLSIRCKDESDRAHHDVQIRVSLFVLKMSGRGPSGAVLVSFRRFERTTVLSYRTRCHLVLVLFYIHEDQFSDTSFLSKLQPEERYTLFDTRTPLPD